MTEQEIDQKRAERARRFSKVPLRYRKLMHRVWTGEASPSQGRKAFCLECQGYEREAVGSCTAYQCSLWHHRPYQAFAAPAWTREPFTTFKPVELTGIAKERHDKANQDTPKGASDASQGDDQGDEENQ